MENQGRVELSMCCLGAQVNDEVVVFFMRGHLGLWLVVLNILMDGE